MNFVNKLIDMVYVFLCMVELEIQPGDFSQHDVFAQEKLKPARLLLKRGEKAPLTIFWQDADGDPCNGEVFARLHVYNSDKASGRKIEFFEKQFRKFVPDYFIDLLHAMR
ncbi:MAG: hypothetical protein PHY34_03950 [Patescibacteria group bacterium]|nr:hypothetical protein [Patescibacteria group bacterium]MDD5715518.1 hypothetical protein [Patescibacteria group bacterium]